MFPPGFGVRVGSGGSGTEGRGNGSTVGLAAGRGLPDADGDGDAEPLPGGGAVGERVGDGVGLGLGQGSSVTSDQVYRPYECTPFCASAIHRWVYGAHVAGPISRMRMPTVVVPSGFAQPATYQLSVARGSVPRMNSSLEANGERREGSMPDP